MTLTTNDIYLFLGKHTDWNTDADNNKNNVCEDYEFVDYFKENWDGAPLTSKDNDIIIKFWNSIDTDKGYNTVNGTKAKDSGALNNNELNAAKIEAAKQVTTNEYKDLASSMCPDWLKRGKIQLSQNLSVSVSGYEKKWIENIKNYITDIIDGVDSSKFADADAYTTEVKTQLEAHLPEKLAEETSRQTQAAFEEAFKKVNISNMDSNEFSIEDLVKKATIDINQKIGANDGGINAGNTILREIEEILDKLCSDIANCLKTENSETIEVAEEKYLKELEEASKNYTLSGREAINATTGDAFNDTYTVKDDDNKTINDVTYSVEVVDENGTAVSGVNINNDGNLSGAIETDGTYKATITAKIADKEITKEVTITVEKAGTKSNTTPGYLIDGARTITAQNGDTFSEDYSVKDSNDNSVTGVTYSVSGNNDVKIDSNTGKLTGAIANNGNYEVTITATKDGKVICKQNVDIRVTVKIAEENFLQGVKWSGSSNLYYFLDSSNKNVSTSSLNNSDFYNLYKSSAFIELHHDNDNDHDYAQSKDDIRQALRNLCNTIASALAANGLDESILSKIKEDIVDNYTNGGVLAEYNNAGNTYERMLGNFTAVFNKDSDGLLSMADYNGADSTVYAVSFSVLVDKMLSLYNEEANNINNNNKSTEDPKTTLLRGVKWQPTSSDFNYFVDSDNDEVSTSKMFTSNFYDLYNGDAFIELHYDEDNNNDYEASKYDIRMALTDLCSTIVDALVASGLKKSILSEISTKIVNYYANDLQKASNNSGNSHDDTLGNFTATYDTNSEGLLSMADRTGKVSTVYAVSFKQLVDKMLEMYDDYNT